MSYPQQDSLRMPSAERCLVGRYKYILGANDRKMQKASNGAPKPLIAPRDHFLDNAGLSESDSDHEAVEEGMLIEAPVTPEKPVPPTRNASDSSDQTQAGDPTAEGSGMALDLVDQMTEAANDGIDKAGQAGSEQAVDALATASAPQVEFIFGSATALLAASSLYNPCDISHLHAWHSLLRTCSQVPSATI